MVKRSFAMPTQARGTAEKVMLYLKHSMPVLRLDQRISCPRALVC